MILQQIAVTIAAKLSAHGVGYPTMIYSGLHILGSSKCF